MTYYEIAKYMTLKLGLNGNLVKAIRNGQEGAYVTKGAQLGGVTNDVIVPKQPSPTEAIDNLIHLYCNAQYEQCYYDPTAL